jgi:hypothetical protein
MVEFRRLKTTLHTPRVAVETDTYMKWYLLKTKPHVHLADKSSFPPRPEGARPSNGNVYTPWFREDEHADEEHIHIKARTKREALVRARCLWALIKLSIWLGMSTISAETDKV